MIPLRATSADDTELLPVKKRIFWDIMQHLLFSDSFSLLIQYTTVTDRQTNTSRHLISRLLKAKFHYTGPTGPDRTGPDQTKSADFVGDPGLVGSGLVGPV